MARRTATQTTESATPEESTVTATATETPAEVTETPTEAPAETTETKADAPIDISAFVAASEQAVAGRDESTGTLSADEIEAVNKVYRELDGVKGKNAAKKHIEEKMLEAVGALDVQLARAYSMLKENLSAAGGSSKTERTPADPKQALVQKRAALLVAQRLVETDTLPEGIDAEQVATEAQALAESLFESADAYRTAATAEVAEGEERTLPEVSPVVRNAFKLATGKASGGGRAAGGSGVRRDIAKHVREAFAEKESGEFLTVAQIANFKSTEYGDDHPSQGAVSARLFPSSGKCTIEGVEPVEKDGDNPRGARKA